MWLRADLADLVDLEFTKGKMAAVSWKERVYEVVENSLSHFLKQEIKLLDSIIGILGSNNTCIELFLDLILF